MRVTRLSTVAALAAALSAQTPDGSGANRTKPAMMDKWTDSYRFCCKWEQPEREWVIRPSYAAMTKMVWMN
jgi:hypothetical protein